MPSCVCPVCDRIVPAEARGLRRVDSGLPSSQTGQLAWYPSKHPRLGDDTGGADCPGVKEEIR